MIRCQTQAIKLVKHIPAWVPGAYFKRYAKHIKNTLETMAQLPYDYAKKEIVGCPDHIQAITNCNLRIWTT